MLALLKCRQEPGNEFEKSRLIIGSPFQRRDIVIVFQKPRWLKLCN
jgi:hypothetical protein